VISAKMRNVGGNTEHNHFAKASSSAAGGDTGVAGSFAINYVDSNTKALGGGVGSVLTLNGGAIDIDAESKSRHYVLASSKGLSKGSGSTGVGASIALEIAMDTTDAGILDATTMNGTANGVGVDVVSTFLSGDDDGVSDDATTE